MSTPSKLRIFVVGPQRAGKSAISNQIAELAESLTSEYRPTRGVRILEFESQISGIGGTDHRNGGGGGGRGKDYNIDIELWDCSGDGRYETVWPVLGKDANGVVLVLNPDSSGQEKELEQWHTYFPNLKDTQCLIMAYRTTEPQGSSLPKLKFAKPLNRFPVVHMNPGTDPSEIRTEFDRLVMNAVVAYAETREKEEQSILA